MRRRTFESEKPSAVSRWSAIRDSTKTASPVLIACGMPCAVHRVARWRRSRSPSSMSSWIRLKLWPSSTAAAPGSARSHDPVIDANASRPSSGRRRFPVDPEPSRPMWYRTISYIPCVVGSRSTTRLRISASTAPMSSGMSRDVEEEGTGRMIPTPNGAARRSEVDPHVPGAGEWYRAVVPGRRLYVTDAIVLSRFDFGEADRILTLLTPELGKIKAIAKGIRRPTSRIGGALEPLAELRVQLAKGRTFDVVTQVTMQHTWLGLRDRLEVTATAWYCAELAERSLEERHAALPVYLLLRHAYELLDAGMAPARVARWFEMRLCEELGVRPEVDRCVECARLLAPDDAVRWVPALGGVLCADHPGPSVMAAGLSTDALKVLKAYQRMDVEGLAGLRLRSEERRVGK